MARDGHQLRSSPFKSYCLVLRDLMKFEFFNVERKASEEAQRLRWRASAEQNGPVAQLVRAHA